MMAPLVPLTLSIAPELGNWLCGSNADAATVAVSAAFQSIVGTTDAELAASKLQQEPAIATQLRLQLAHVAAGHEEAARAAELDALATTLRDAADARPSAPGTTTPATVAWSAPVISSVVLLTFGAVMAMILLRGMPNGAETAVNMLLGTLAAMATSVVSYWVGSSAGSARKDDRLAQSGR